MESKGNFKALWETKFIQGNHSARIRSQNDRNEEGRPLKAKPRKAAKAEKLTEQNIEREKPPAPGEDGKHTQRFLWDTKERGLALRVLDTGTRTFLLQTRVEGMLHRVKIGRYPDWTLAQARKKAAELRVALAHGETVTDKTTFGALAEAYLKHIEGHSKKSAPDVRKRVTEHCTAWFGRKAASIRRSDVHELHLKIGATYPAQANRVVAIIRTIFNHAIAFELFKHPNPAKLRKEDRFPEEKRERYLTYEELTRLNEALLQEPDWRHRAYFPLLLVTGARKSEWLGARWENLDLAQGLWHKPVTKTGRKTALLPPQAVAILEALPSRDKSPWVFPGYGKSGHMRDGFEAWNRIRDRAKIPDLRQHDLRHSFASFLANRGTSIQIISKLLGHANIATTQRYSHIRDDAQREALEANAALMITNGK